MTYGSVCSGIEVATVAWHPLGWRPAFFAEIEPFPSAVLKHHYPTVPNAGDFTAIKGDEYGAIDLLVGGTPCQDFSIAGLRAGVAGERGNLTLEFLRLLDRTRPRWMVWENVPGVLSSTSHHAADPCAPPDPVDMELDGQEVDTEDEYAGEELHALNSFLAGLSELGYGWAMGTLDAQHFGVPQRRRRIFVIGYFGDWRRAAAVLFERHSLSGHPAPRREAGKVAPTIPSRSSGGGGLGTDFDLDGGLVHHQGTPVGIDGGDVGFALRSSASHSGDKGDGGVNTTMVAHEWPAEVAPTLNAHFGELGLEDQHIKGGQGCLSSAVTAKWAKGTGGPAGDECQNLIATEVSLTKPTQGGFPDSDSLTETAHTLLAKENSSHDATLETYIAHSLRGEGFDASEDGTGRGTPLVPVPAVLLTMREGAEGGGQGATHPERAERSLGDLKSTGAFPAKGRFP